MFHQILRIGLAGWGAPRFSALNKFLHLLPQTGVTWKFLPKFHQLYKKFAGFFITLKQVIRNCYKLASYGKFSLLSQKFSFILSHTLFLPDHRQKLWSANLIYFFLFTDAIIWGGPHPSYHMSMTIPPADTHPIQFHLNQNVLKEQSIKKSSGYYPPWPLWRRYPTRLYVLLNIVSIQKHDLERNYCSFVSYKRYREYISFHMKIIDSYSGEWKS